jgi:hypothetical protein
VNVVERALLPDRDARFASALEMRSALAPFAGPASHAARFAPSSEPVRYAAPANLPQHTGPAQVFEVAAAVPKTLPPEGDPAMLAYKGGTQEVSDDAVREALRASALPGNLPAYGYPPSPATYGAPPVPHKRRSRTGLWVGLSLLILLGLGGAALAAVFYQQHQPDSSAPPLVLDPPTPETTVSPLIDAGSGAQVGKTPPVIAVTPTRPGTPTTGTPTTGPTVVRPTDAGTPVVTDAGRTTFPFPFPLPSTLPPLPSTFPTLPKTFPSTFPTTLPPGFPTIPGFPGAPAAAGAGGK